MQYCVACFCFIICIELVLQTMLVLCCIIKSLQMLLYISPYGMHIGAWNKLVPHGNRSVTGSLMIRRPVQRWPIIALTLAMSCFSLACFI